MFPRDCIFLPKSSLFLDFSQLFSDTTSPSAPLIMFSAILCPLLCPLFLFPEIMASRDYIHDAFINFIFILPTLPVTIPGYLFL